jgi:long-chain-fatty-acid--CoA ligase ACSBG
VVFILIYQTFSGQIIGIYTSNSSDAACYILESCRANIAVVDTDEQLQKILNIKDKLPHLKAIIQVSLNSTEGVWKWNDFEDMNIECVEDEYQKRASEIKANSCCCLVFTSGTTG